MEMTDFEVERGLLRMEYFLAIAAELWWRVSVGGLIHYTHLDLQSQFPAEDGLANHLGPMSHRCPETERLSDTPYMQLTLKLVEDPVGRVNRTTS
jgi:hypothetical protein